ncbi:GNAT family N-acetyltransferase [Paracoccus denitrificans]|jgi:GNAT superfamily N-acetyltransferase|uniref:GNAT family N-acetyltransferase n=1 Tax=Paracoccus denitrificans TaxID=266 RepID=UPI00005534AD|nr:GNAT family N-acetyltransferase [Paracoccus denitrificans]MBB4626808.1 GNAT superfamily N-acetyltransferase [Paracoccus denitrificans]MCU7427709.1 GNAT family N-acetyltransferase [Paracoccus denitrificans]QAR24969.1 GNAT family N-acetyltransferase [Paracoccus denitrificans]WQO34130.1 GNAT family N-acetyltransferase [Paracoccus denitrificans]SDI06005.1 Ribosomal protein S18 acetylase RimI [Paracoccus denitrificans]
MPASLLIRTLKPNDAPRLAELINGYRDALSERRPLAVMTDSVALEMITKATGDRIILLGAETDGRLAGFAHAFDLPEIVSGSRAGQLDDLFVSPDARGAGVARALITRLAEIGAYRDWAHLRWLVPQGNSPARQLYLRIAEQAPWDSFRMELPAKPTQTNPI